jgi:hypothetical protein
MNIWERVVFAFRCFFSILFHAEIPDDISGKLVKSVAPAAPPAARLKESPPPAAESLDRAVQMLALLQRDGRLIDFLAENIAAYPDVQLGAAVRNIHESCGQSLERYVTLEPILDSEEEQPVTVPAGFDPASIKLIGNVVGAPPVRGILRHRGWRVKQLNLPPLPHGDARMVVAPAEVELP